MAIRSDITEPIYRSEDKTLRYVVYQSDGTTVQDVTGWAITWIVTPVGSTTASLTKTVGSGVTLTTPASGIVDVAVTSAQSAALSNGNYHIQLRRTDSGFNTVLSFGTWSIRTAPAE